MSVFHNSPPPAPPAREKVCFTSQLCGLINTVLTAKHQDWPSFFFFFSVGALPHQFTLISWRLSFEHCPTGAIVFVLSSCLIDISTDVSSDALNTSLDQLIGTVNQIQRRMCIQTLGLRFIWASVTAQKTVLEKTCDAWLWACVNLPTCFGRFILQKMCRAASSYQFVWFRCRRAFTPGSLILEHLDTKDQTSQLAGCICRRPTGNKKLHSVASTKQSFNKMRLNAQVVILRHFTTSSSGLLGFFLQAHRRPVTARSRCEPQIASFRRLQRFSGPVLLNRRRVAGGAGFFCVMSDEQFWHLGFLLKLNLAQ